MPSTSGTAHRLQPSPIIFFDYESDYNRPSTSGPSRKVSRCYLGALRSMDKRNSPDPVDIDEDSMPMETAPAHSLRKASRRRLHVLILFSQFLKIKVVCKRTFFENI
ncbi:unnamed protein product [Caenorhabditis nigoni]